MKCLYVYNPISGKGQAEKKRHYIVKKLRQRFGDVEVFATREAGQLRQKAAEACGKYDVFIFAGGDGSFNEVVTGLAEREERPVLGYIPTGTVNDIARSTGIARSIRGAVKNIVTGCAYPLDVMRVNDRYVMYVACSGGLTGCSYKAEQSAKKKIGKFAYAVEVLKHELVFDEYPVAFESKDDLYEDNAVMVMIMNGRSVASMPVNRGGLLDDGEAEIIIVRADPRRKEPKVHKHFRFIFRVLRMFVRGFRRLKKSNKMYYTYKGSRFSVKVPEDVVWNFDGEEGVRGNIEVNMLNKHVRLIMPCPRGVGSVLVDGIHGADKSWENQTAVQ